MVGTIADLRLRVEEYAAAGVSELVIAGFNQSPQEHAAALYRLRTEVLGVGEPPVSRFGLT